MFFTHTRYLGFLVGKGDLDSVDNLGQFECNLLMVLLIRSKSSLLSKETLFGHNCELIEMSFPNLELQPFQKASTNTNCHKLNGLKHILSV